MPKSQNQKLKLFYILKILKEYTDEEHAIGTGELIEKLAGYDIHAERKSIYSDIEALRLLGWDILSSRSEGLKGYYLAAREFELAELKFLVDATQSSKFITKRKSQALIRKLGQFASLYEAGQLQRQVYVSDRVKMNNENIFIHMDGIHRAIQGDRQISFSYFDWTPQKEKRLRREGEPYIVSPWMLTFAEENYYLLAFDADADMMKYYRIDRMQQLQILKKQRDGKDRMEHFDPAAFSKKTFGMFAGREEQVTLLFHNRLTSVAMDRFGSDVAMRIRDEEHFSVRVPVYVSGQFFGWLAGLSGEAGILSPQDVKKEYEEYLAEILKKSLSQAVRP